MTDSMDSCTVRAKFTTNNEVTMKPFIKDMTISQEIKTNGIEIQVDDNSGVQIGDLYVTKVGLIWCQGKTTRPNGKQISWDDFAKYMGTL